MRRPFFDSDTEVERRTGTSVPLIFAARGESAFRAEERAALSEALARPVPSVIAVAGGAVIDPELRRRIRGGNVVVWLDMTPHAIAARVGAAEGRPLLEADPKGALLRLAARRRSVYNELSDSAVKSDFARPEVLAESVLRAARAILNAPGQVSGE
jgi:shikimate kinase